MKLKHISHGRQEDWSELVSSLVKNSSYSRLSKEDLITYGRDYGVALCLSCCKPHCDVPSSKHCWPSSGNTWSPYQWGHYSKSLCKTHWTSSWKPGYKILIFWGCGNLFSFFIAFLNFGFLRYKIGLLTHTWNGWWGDKLGLSAFMTRVGNKMCWFPSGHGGEKVENVDPEWRWKQELVWVDTDVLGDSSMVSKHIP